MIDISGRGLRNIVVLTVQTAKVAARAGQRQTRRTRMEVVQRLFFYRVDGQRTRLTVDLAHEPPTLISSATANTRLALSNATMVRTKRTLHPSIIQPLIIFTLENIHHIYFLTTNCTNYTNFRLALILFYNHFILHKRIR